MQRFILATLFIFLFQFKMIAQIAVEDNKGVTVAGNVIDSVTHAPVEYATVSLFTGGNKKALNGSLTDSAGRFNITGIKNGDYTILIEFIGYTNRSVQHIVVDKKNAVIRLKNIALSKSQVMLQDVTVVAQKNLVENRIDKMVFNAEKDLTSQSGVATDVLKKIPQVSVDVDGNVQLAGSGGIRFLINGKPSSAFGSSIADVLQSIPASQIKSVEVITNPGAKYDAQGLGGIINIILKESKVKGINGNISLSAGTRAENGSFNLNVRRGNFGAHAFVSGNLRVPVDNTNTYERLSVDAVNKKNILLQQAGTSRFKRHGQQAGVGFDWTLNKHNSINSSLTYNTFGNSGYGLVNQVQVVSDQNTANILSNIASNTNANNNFIFRTTDVSLAYKKTFNQEDKELNINFNSSFGHNKVSANNTQVLQPQDSLFYGVNSNNTGRQNQKELEIDYTQPIHKKIMLGMGGKMVYTEITSNANAASFEPVSKNYLYDKGLSNSLDYKQKVYALYTEISLPVAHLFETKVGTRYERTEINSFYSNAQIQSAAPGYNTWVPSVFLLKRLGDLQTLKLSYSKRIERPDYGDLNPFINTNDPKNITAGNPYLKPEIGQRIEFSYTRNFAKTGSFMATAFYRMNQNDIQPFLVFYPTFKVGDSVYTNVSVSTRENIGTEKNMGTNFFTDLHITSKLTLRGNLFLFRRHIINTINPGYNITSFNYRININAAYQFSHDIAAEFFGNFNSPRNEAQGKYPSFTSYNMAVRKQFLHKKASIALTAVNPFNQYLNQRTVLYGPNFTVNSYRKIPFRSFGINLTWKFGKLEFKKEKQEEKDNQPPEG